MISRLRGHLWEADAGRVVVEASGVGYEVFVPHSVFTRLPPEGEPIEFYVRHVVREDGQFLYGFQDAFQRKLFDLLTEVKGCGPKIGLSLLSELGDDAIASAIQVQDAKMLARAPGVGPRLAERIILELRDKVNQELLGQKIARAVVSDRPLRIAATDDLVEALVALGYRRLEAETAATEARQTGESVEDQLKVALRSLRR